MTTPLLQVEDLHVWFDLAEGGELHAVQGIGLTLEPGGRLGLVGESGCGKTTTALAIMGLLPPSASVVFPQPDSPTRPKISPSLTSSDTSRTADTGP